MTAKRVVITGVTRGLGRALAERFIQLGHRVAGCGRSVEIITKLRQAYGPPHHFATVDVTSDAAVGVWVRQVLAQLGAPDLLLNNAALINRSAPLWRVPAEEFDAVLQTNVCGVFHVLRHFLPPMIDRDAGVIVNFSSGWGRSADAEVAPYCATKWAIEGLTQALARELPGSLAAVAFNPGIIHTEMLESCFGDAAASYPSPSSWAERAASFLLRLGRGDNGRSLTMSG